MESAIIGVRAMSTEHCLPLDWKQQIFCPGKMRKSPAAFRKNLASIRVRCENTQGGRIELDRRRLLLSSSTLGVSAFTIGKAKSEPFPAPDLSSCTVPPTDLPTGAYAPGGCCPPYTAGTTAVDFEFPTSLPMRTRKAAHLVKDDPVYLKKYEAAVKAMRDLPEDDPWSLVQQAKVHCAYCNGAYKVGSNYIKVHETWNFAPFHRWYMYFHERILGRLINDDTFALPFWNWDAEEGMSMPTIFTDTSSALYDENRDPCHQPPTLINLTDPTSCDGETVSAIYSNIYTHMVSGAETTELFHGGAYRYGSTFTAQTGTLEASPHNMVHPWAGSSDSTKNPNREDLGSLYSAGRDPLFYCHHSNVDRMWFIWNDTLGNSNYDDEDLTKSKFLFYDENKKLVQVNAGDCYDISKLKYQYQKVDKADLPWLNNGRSVKKAGTLRAKPNVSTFKVPIDSLKKLTGPVTVPVARPTTTRTSKQAEVLVIDGLEKDRSVFCKFAVFINLPEADASTPINSPHFAGLFTNFGHGVMTAESMKSMSSSESFKLAITETLEDIGADGDAKVLVTLVPETTAKLPKTPIKFSSIRIEYVSK